VELQLERVKRTARGQGVEIIFDKTVVKYLAKIGYLPKYGARELRRQIKSEIENKLAKEILRGNVSEGSNVKIDYDQSRGMIFTKITKKELAKA
jgi:ATP-dependent Clp protease ATP-binding subunit ClpC